MAAKNKPFDFEQALETLEQLVESMEEGNLSLEESMKAFEKGIRLTRECQVALEQAEQKVKVLVSEGSADQDPEVKDLQSGDEDEAHPF